LIKFRREKGEGVEYGDTLEELMKGYYKTGEKLSDDHICGILLGGLFAGEHTSSVTTTWTLLNILKNKEVLNDILNSLSFVFKSNDELTFDNYRNIEEFQLLPMCIRETLRLFPPIIMLFRYVKKEKKLEDGKIIPKGNIVAVSPAFTGRLADVYPSPDKFDPYRWKEERLEHKKVIYSILSFGAGRHRCIGENFALFQVTSILALFFKHLDMKYDNELPSVNYTSLVASPNADKCYIEYKKKINENNKE